MRGHVPSSQNLYRSSVSPDEFDRNAQKAEYCTHVLRTVGNASHLEKTVITLFIPGS